MPAESCIAEKSRGDESTRHGTRRIEVVCTAGTVLVLALVALGIAAMTRALDVGARDILGLALVAGSLLVFGLVCALYLAILRRPAPLVAGTYDWMDAESILWKHQHMVRIFGMLALKFFFPVFARAALYRLFGARIGRGAIIAGVLLDTQLLHIEDRAILGHNSCVVTHSISGGSLILKPVLVGEGVTIGVNSVVMPGVTIGKGSVVGPGAVVTMDTHIPPFEFWGGIPARRIKALSLNN